MGEAALADVELGEQGVVVHAEACQTDFWNAQEAGILEEEEEAALAKLGPARLTGSGLPGHPAREASQLVEQDESHFAQQELREMCA